MRETKNSQVNADDVGVSVSRNNNKAYVNGNKHNVLCMLWKIADLVSTFPDGAWMNLDIGDPSDIYIGGWWDRPETDEERAQRERDEAASREGVLRRLKDEQDRLTKRIAELESSG